MSLCGVSVVYRAKRQYMAIDGAAIPNYSLRSRRSLEPNFEVFGIAPSERGRTHTHAQALYGFN
jgi:hypothetical protein